MSDVAEVGQARAPIVGREREIAVLEDFVQADLGRVALVLTGGPGIGKTTLWEAGVVAARERGLRVLSARASEAEARLSFAGLIDLLDGVGGEELAALPAPQLHALEVALLRMEATDVPPEPGAIALGFLNALRALAAHGGRCWWPSTTPSGSILRRSRRSRSPRGGSRASRLGFCSPSVPGVPLRSSRRSRGGGWGVSRSARSPSARRGGCWASVWGSASPDISCAGCPRRRSETHCSPSSWDAPWPRAGRRPSGRTSRCRTRSRTCWARVWMRCRSRCEGCCLPLP